MQARRRVQGADAGHRIEGELRQRLAAERGAAGAENDDVGGALAEPGGGLLDAGEVVLLLGQAQQRQRALGVMLPQPVERALGTGKRIGQRAVGQAVLADGLGERAVDGLNQGHRALRRHAGL